MTEANDEGPGGSGRDLSEFTVGLDPVLTAMVQARARLLGVSPRRVIEGAVVRDLTEFRVRLDPVLASTVKAQARRRGVSPEGVIEAALARALGAVADQPLDLIDVEC